MSGERTIKNLVKTVLVACFLGSSLVASMAPASADEVPGDPVPSVNGPWQQEYGALLAPATVTDPVAGRPYRVYSPPEGTTPRVAPDGTVVVEDQTGTLVGRLGEPLAYTASGAVNLLPRSAYSVRGRDVYQALHPSTPALARVTFAPTLIRTGSAEDTEMVRAYRHYFEVSARPARQDPSQPTTAYVAVPADYIYDVNHARRTLHDYCSFSPDSWGNADFRGPCARHDQCIENNLWRAPEDRKQHRAAVCDADLPDDMHENCQVYSRKALQSCEAIAGVYFAAVSVRTGFY
ncbi:phospholipase A2 [Arthrobacter halodurans]|uniref:Phospholipase A2 n=1 Tax=Arthrobacter halodurans TaxID=516699 RepID=A0ABV4USL5_9MICC